MTHATLLLYLDGRKLKVKYYVTTVGEYTRITKLVSNHSLIQTHSSYSNTDW